MLDLLIVLGYVILFVLFLKLIGEQDELHFMKKNVLVFFVFMMVILMVQLVFNIIFYTVTSFRLNNLLFTNYVTTTCSSDYSRSFSSGVEVTTSKRQPEIVF